MHSTRLIFTLAIAAALAPVVPAWAATFSSPLLTAIAGQSFQCRVSNVGTAPINVTGTLYDSAGAVEPPVSNTCVTTYAGVLPAGATCFISHGVGAVRCVVDASSSKLRVLLMVFDINGPLATEPATKK